MPEPSPTRALQPTGLACCLSLLLLCAPAHAWVLGPIAGRPISSASGLSSSTAIARQGTLFQQSPSQASWTTNTRCIPRVQKQARGAFSWVVWGIVLCSTVAVHMQPGRGAGFAAVLSSGCPSYLLHFVVCWCPQDADVQLLL